MFMLFSSIGSIICATTRRGNGVYEAVADEVPTRDEMLSSYFYTSRVWMAGCGAITASRILETAAQDFHNAPSHIRRRRPAASSRLGVTTTPSIPPKKQHTTWRDARGYSRRCSCRSGVLP